MLHYNLCANIEQNNKEVILEDAVLCIFEFAIKYYIQHIKPLSKFQI